MSNTIKRRLANSAVLAGAVGAIVAVVVIADQINQLNGRKWG